MSAAQPLLPLPRPSRARVRSLRRPFTPSRTAGPYRLPHEVWDRLVSTLTPARNRDAALALAVFLGRFWSTPARLVSAFPIDRRELANRPDLRLTEAQVRGAIRALEAVGFLDRAISDKGSRHKLTGAGELHRKPVLSSSAVTTRSASAGPTSALRRLVSGIRTFVEHCPVTASRASTGFQSPAALSWPKDKGSEAAKVFMGELRPTLPKPPSLNPKLEATLERWKKAADGQGLLRLDQLRLDQRDS
jgi:hypothetical protein